jgi:UDP-GlcNAc:undecaprenyl-phosphate GlcNAc-1-phosphate transferase
VAAVSALVTALSLPWWRAIFHRRNWVDEPGGRKQHTAPIVLAGGVAVFTGLLAGLLLATGLLSSDAFASGGARHSGLSWRWLVPALGITFLGWWDDVVELRPLLKFAGQFVIAAVTVSVGARLPILAGIPWMQWALSVLFLLTLINAFNFLDNMNGLCAGLALIASSSLAVILARLDPGAGCFGVALAGACLGFLPRNYPRATVFLGDAGSHLMGYGIGVLALRACDVVAGGGGNTLTALAPIVVLTVPLIDIVQVVTGRGWRGQPIYLGDTHHLSHLLQRCGLSAAAAVGILWALSIATGLLGILLTGQDR